MDLSTTYLGLQLKNPLVPSASPLMRNLDNLKKMEAAGAAAVVLDSLFEEQILRDSQTLDRALSAGVDSFAEALAYFPDLPAYRMGAEDYLERIHKAKQAVSIPVIASLNGYSTGGWLRYARQIQQAGADALELNMYYLPTDPLLVSAAVDDLYVNVVTELRPFIDVPLAVKLSPFCSSLPNLAKRLAQAGANGLVLFNRFYQPDIDLERLDVAPRLTLSTSAELRLPLRWIAILYKRVNADLGLTTGVHTAEDVLKAVLAGAAVTQLASELMQNGIGRLSGILKEVEQWLVEHEYESLAQGHGSVSMQTIADPSVFERANYVKVLGSYSA